MSVRPRAGDARTLRLSPQLLAALFVVWLGTTGGLLWQLDSENRLRGITCSGPR